MVSELASQAGEKRAGDQVLEDAKKTRKKSKSGAQYDCEVTCLDGTVLNLSVDKSAKGEVLLNNVIEELSITDKEYVGLMFFNEKKIKMWLDVHKDMKYQLGVAEPNFVCRVKFYEPEPARVKDEYMRYWLYLQLRDDLVKGQLVCSQNIYAILGSYTAQAELGDFHLSEHDHNYLDDYEFAPNQKSELRKAVHEIHKQHRGQSPAQAELNFLEVAKKIPRYGVDVHNAQDADGPVELGVAAIGINGYRNSWREHLFRWQIVESLLYNRRKLTLKLKEPVDDENDDGSNKKKPQLTYFYFFDSAKECKQCYKSCVEYHTFFRLTRPDVPRKKTDSLKLGSSFRYSDKTLYMLRHPQSLNDSVSSDTPFTRTPSKRRLPPEQSTSNDVQASPDDEKPDTVIEEDIPEVAVAVEEKAPAQYEEIEIDEANPEDDTFNPKEWEIVEKTLPDGTKKRYRRRIIIVLLKKAPVEEAPAQYEEIEIDEANPEDDKFDPKEWEDVEKTLPDGTKKKYRRRIIITSIGRRAYADETPIEYEEVDIDEVDPEDDPEFDPEEWEVVERAMPGGTKKKYRRRIIISSIVQKASVEETPMEYEEVEIDEANPEDDKFDPKEWEIVEKALPDGTKKQYRRRVVLFLCNKAPTKETPVEYEEVEIDEANPADDKFDPTEWEIVEKTLPDGSKKRYRRRVITTTITTVTTTTYIVRPDGTEEAVCVESKPIESTTAEFINDPDIAVETETVPDLIDSPYGTSEKVMITVEDVIVPDAEIITEQSVDMIEVEEKPAFVGLDMDDLLSEINAMSRSLDDQELSLEEADKKKKDGERNRKLEEERNRRLAELSEDERRKLEEEEKEREEDRKRKEEEERKIQEEEGEKLNATITSIFTLPETDDSEIIRKRHEEPNYTFDDSTLDSTKEHSDDEMFEFVAVADVALTVPDEDTIRTASLSRQNKNLQNDEGKRASLSDDPSKVMSLDRRYNKMGATMLTQRHSYGHAPDREYNTLPRKLSADNTDNVRKSSSTAGLEKDNLQRPHEAGPNSSIIYTVTDVSNVEQGVGGFVRAVRAKHEIIATEENNTAKQNSRHFSEEHYVPKGHVPTRTISFNENDKAKVIKTKEPPVVAAKPTVIIPASSELPDEEVVFQVNQMPDESNPDLENDIFESTDVPEVETQIIMIEEAPDDDFTVVPIGSEPGLVETQVIQIIPATENQTVETERIEILSAQTETHQTERQCIVTTHTLPTEVITKTITIEGDSSSMTPEELQKLLEESGGATDVLDSSQVTTTQVVRTTTVQKVITGQTITVTGDRNEEEMQRLIQEAVENATSSADDDNATIVMTAIQDVHEEMVDDDENGDTEI